MNDLTEPAGIAALSAGALALIALLVALVLAFRVRKLRAAQKAVLGDSGQSDLVAHAASLSQAFDALHERVEEVATTVDQQGDQREGARRQGGDPRRLGQVVLGWSGSEDAPRV